MNFIIKYYTDCLGKYCSYQLYRLPRKSHGGRVDPTSEFPRFLLLYILYYVNEPNWFVLMITIACALSVQLLYENGIIWTWHIYAERMWSDAFCDNYSGPTFQIEYVYMIRFLPPKKSQQQMRCRKLYQTCLSIFIGAESSQSKFASCNICHFYFV